jgi:hypothetical protein
MNRPNIKKAYDIIATAKLYQSNVLPTIENCEIETERLTRCVNFYYIKEKHNMQYDVFTSHFLHREFKEIIFGTTYNHKYLSDDCEIIVDI